MRADVSQICFEPGLETDITYQLADIQDGNIEISTFGNFAKYITFDTNKLSLKANKTATFSGHLKLPQVMEDEIETLLVVATPVASPIQSGAGVILAAGANLKIYKCWEEKHAIVEYLRIAVLQDKIDFITVCKNNGNIDIAEVVLSIDVYDSKDEKIMTFNPSSSLLTGEAKNLIGTYPDKLPPGKYTAETTIAYDGIESDRKVTEEFEIEDPTKATTATKKSSSVVAAPTMVAKQTQTAAEGVASAEGFNWLLYIVLPAAILIVAGTLLFLRLRKK